MGRQKRQATLNLDSFLDIMTCLVGVLIFIILLTGVDASQIKRIIPTPMDRRESDKRPVYIECRSNELFRVDIIGLRQKAQDYLSSIDQQAKGDMVQMLKFLGGENIGDDAYTIDLTYALVGQFALHHKGGSSGYALVDAEKEMATDWFGKILTSLNNEEEMIVFLVRDDSFQVFQRARHLTWANEVEVSYELLDSDAPIKFGLGGSRSFAQ